MKKVYVVGLLAALVVILAACGGESQQAVSFDFEMKEYTFTPERLNLKVGQEVTLNLSNSGQLQHEIIFGRERRTWITGLPDTWRTCSKLEV